MKIFPYRISQIGKGMWGFVSQYHEPVVTFGLPERTDGSSHAGKFVEVGAPGSGFFARSSESSSYQNFVNSQTVKLRHNYWNLLLGKQFSFAKEIDRVKKAQTAETDELKRRILDCYLECLALAEDAEESKRIINALKRYRNYYHKKSGVSREISHFKTRQARTSHDARMAQLNLWESMCEEQQEAWVALGRLFGEMCRSHRIWHVGQKKGRQEYTQVFFDCGIFDFINAGTPAPILRTPNEKEFCMLYPDFAIFVRSTIDFDIIPYSNMHMTYNEIPYSQLEGVLDLHLSRSHKHHRSKKYVRDYNDENTNLLVKETLTEEGDAIDMSHQHQRVVGELTIPELGLTYLSLDNRSVKNFVRAFLDYKSC